MTTLAQAGTRGFGDGVERAALFLVPLALFWVTLNPLTDLSPEQALSPIQGSDLLNQAVYLGLFGLMGAKLVRMGWRRASPLLHPAYGAVLAWFAVSSVLGLYPGLSLRRLALSVIVMAIVGVMLLLPRTPRQFAAWLAWVALAVVAACYAAVVLVPHLAIHQADVVREAELAGDWRGLYDHKSTAGPMMVFFLLIGGFLAGQGRPALGGALAVLSAVFLLFTGAKQPIALVLFAVAWPWLASELRSTAALAAACLVPLALYNLFTVGSSVFPWVAAVDAKILSDPSFTNRTGIWDYAVTHLLQRPLTGYGFLGFWNTDATRFDDGLGRNAWTSQATDSHNSYLDLAVTTGLPGLGLAVWAVVVLPVLDYARARRDPDRAALALLFFRIWFFCVFAAGLETIFFLRDAATWVTFLIAAFGLRYLSTYRLAEASGATPAPSSAAATGTTAQPRRRAPSTA